MKDLNNFKDDIQKCSKCGLCQAECPIYKITGNDCAVSRGQFVMLKGVIKGDLKITKTINKYLDLCLKCGACSKFCPSGIDIVDVIVSAKHEYFKSHPIEKIKTFFQKKIVFGLIPHFWSKLIPSVKSETFTDKVLYFGGCGNKIKSNKAVVRILNSLNIEVISPNFNCCGIPYFSRGDLKEFHNSLNEYIKILKKYDIQTVITTCASCEKTLKDYIKWTDSKENKKFLQNIEVKNIYELLKESNFKPSLKKKIRVTYHKPCNINNFSDIKWLLNNTENLDYVEMEDFDKCCGLNGLSKFKEYKIMTKIYEQKQKNIKSSGTNTVLTSCLGCEAALKSYSQGKYKVCDLIEFIYKYTELD